MVFQLGTLRAGSVLLVIVLRVRRAGDGTAHVLLMFFFLALNYDLHRVWDQCWHWLRLCIGTCWKQLVVGSHRVVGVLVQISTHVIVSITWYIWSCACLWVCVHGRTACTFRMFAFDEFLILVNLVSINCSKVLHYNSPSVYKFTNWCMHAQHVLWIEIADGIYKLCDNLNGTWHPGWSQDRILICESLQSMWFEVSIAFTLVKIVCWCDTMKLVLPNDPNTHTAPTWTRHEMIQEEEVELDTKYTQCNGCGKKFLNDSALKAHCWSKPNCRRAAPTWMQNVIHQEEMELDIYTRCNGCGKKYLDDESLKVHCWSKPVCRSAAPKWMRHEICQEELKMDTYKHCKNCGTQFVDDEALKAHCWSKPNCRSAAPRWILREISQKEMVMKTYTSYNGCGKKFVGDYALKAHCWAKATCRSVAATWIQREIKEESKASGHQWRISCKVVFIFEFVLGVWSWKWHSRHGSLFFCRIYLGLLH